MAISVKSEDDLQAEHMGAPRPVGMARSCMTYAGEKARHRVISADGQDFIVTTAADARVGSGFLTGVYPVSRGYLMMMRQPLVETNNATLADALEAHDQLVRALVEVGARIVRAQAVLRARKRAETGETRAQRAQASLRSRWPLQRALPRRMRSSLA